MWPMESRAEHGIIIYFFLHQFTTICNFVLNMVSYFLAKKMHKSLKLNSFFFPCT